MALNKNCIGKEYSAVTTGVTLDAMQKYARAYNDDNRFFFDPTAPGGIVAPPMFGVTVIWPSMMQAATDPDVHADLLRLVHGEQDMQWGEPIRPGDQITSSSKIQSIETKSTGETMTVELAAHNQKKQPVLKTLFTVFIRNPGGGKSASGDRPAEAPRKIIFEISQKIDEDQTYRYKEASGDQNPIHVDPNVAKMAGLPGIIVHGLCTMAFTSRVAIDKLCGGDPKRLKRLRVRFARPVLPGQTITTKVWEESEGAGTRIYGYETFGPDGQAVIRAGLAEVQA